MQHPFQLTILGSSSATPTSFRNPTSQYLDFFSRCFLIDCGEGTQVQIRRHKLRLSRIKHILISHMHGDHFFGLPGLLSSLHLLNHKQDIHLYGPEALFPLLDSIFLASDTKLRFTLVYHPFNPSQSQVIYRDEKLEVSTLPLQHRIPCCGFLFRELPGLLSINKEAIASYGLNHAQIMQIKEGNDFTDADGNTIKNAHLTRPPRKPVSYAYCSDTAFHPPLIPLIKGVDLLYHESTFCNDLQMRAAETYHSTAAEAARIASMSEVKKLLLGHFSARYNNLDGFLEEAKPLFENTELALEGTTFSM